ncbi:MAG: endonuclease NucS, partial [Conexibacteraceae bacterium]|nr:endonuclease NucS [Conexibacteraceae bacterium]
QEWLAHDISILDPELLVIGSEVQTDFNGLIDLLCIDREGELVIVELKRDRTPREVVALALDYASWVTTLSSDRVTEIAGNHLEGGFDDAFTKRFGTEVPETLNGNHRILVVGSEIDASSERIIRYLSDTHGVNINAATFQYFRPPGGSELVARVFVLEPSELEIKTRTKGKHRPSRTYGELRELAVEAGVVEDYDYAVSALERVLKKEPRLSQIAFTGPFGDNTKTVVSLLPAESNIAAGLRYQLYSNRLAELVHPSGSELEDLIPQSHEFWEYYGNADPDWQGFQGFIKSHEEIDRLADALR